MITVDPGSEQDYALGESPDEVRQSRLAQMESVLNYTRRLLSTSPSRHDLRAEIDAMMVNIQKVRAGIHVPDPILEEKERVHGEIRAEFPSLEAWCDHANESARRLGFRVIDSVPPHSRDVLDRLQRISEQEAAD